MPGVRRAIVFDLPRGRLALAEHRRLARLLKAEGYGTALIMPRTWKAALAPALAGILQRVGMVGELRFGLINDLRWNERKLPRMVDRCAVLALPRSAAPYPAWPPPRLVVAADEIAAWRQQRELPNGGAPVVALCPGAVGAGKQWPVASHAALAKELKERGVEVWVLGGPQEKAAAERISAGGAHARDLTGADLREAVRALAAADVAVANDSGLLHVAAALGSAAIGLFGPSDPSLWAPLNPLAATIEAPRSGPSAGHAGRGSMRDITVESVLAAIEAELGRRSHNRGVQN
jgi:heptosyltransferase-2